MNGFCFLSAVAMRREASHSSEMVNQLLFGDGVVILEYRPEWVRVRSLFDGYVGWVSDKQIVEMEQLPQMDCVVASDCMVRYKDRDFIVPAGSSCRSEWLIQCEKEPLNRDIVLICKSYMHAPYLWGGRTHMGIDCSGFTQIVYKICGKTLPRDAWQQAELGKLSMKLEEAQKGDLAFFCNDEGRIVHVGIVVDSPDGLHIYHASGEVRYDKLTAEGIWNEDKGCYTHKLAGIFLFNC